MSQSKNGDDDDRMRDHYDFSNAVRGKYAEKFAEGANVVLLDPDVAEFFPTSESVNRALRALREIAIRQSDDEAAR